MMNVVRRHSPSGYRRCAFTGHRLQKMPFGFNEDDPRCIAFKAQLRAAIEDLIGHGYAHFISGGALGMDMFAAEAVMDLKRDYPWVILEMAVPFEAQPAKWSQEYQNRYYRLMGVVLQGEYFAPPECKKYPAISRQRGKKRSSADPFPAKLYS